jgi:hypothetical protein
MVSINVWFEGRENSETFHLENDELYVRFRTYVRSPNEATTACGAEIDSKGTPTVFNFRNISRMELRPHMR